jgi:Ca2+-binding RTX toxin-like protein
LDIVTNVGTVSVSLTGTAVNNTVATGAPAISDTTPTEGTAITASLGTVADINGVPGVLSFSWRQSITPAGAIQPAVISTNPTFTPGPAQVDRRLQVTVTFVDGAGTAESRPSAITTVVGDLFTGTAGVDILAGTAGQDELHGLGANDNLSTGAGDDRVSGDAGDDTIATGAGDDIITFSGTGEGFDAVTGGADVTDDTILALANDTNIGLRSISTVEIISANGHSGVRILGSPGNDVLNFNAVTLIGIIEINGGGGNDAITGSAAADVIVGLGGTDTLNGGGGADTIEGGAGNDALAGGAGNDTLRYRPGGFGADNVTGFDSNAAGGQDLIDLSALGITAANFAANVSRTAGTNTVITVLGHGTIRLAGINGPAIDITDFILAP